MFKLCEHRGPLGDGLLALPFQVRQSVRGAFFKRGHLPLHRFNPVCKLFNLVCLAGRVGSNCLTKFCKCSLAHVFG